MSAGAETRLKGWLMVLPLLMAACQDEVGRISLALVWSADPNEHPLEQVADAVRISVSGPDGVLVEPKRFSTARGDARIPSVPAGSDRVIVVEGVGPEGNIVSRGRSGPLTIGDGSHEVELFVGRVGRFSSPPASRDGGNAMKVARAFHSATLTPDGEVLIAGGAIDPWRPESGDIPAATRVIERVEPNNLRFVNTRCQGDGECMARPRLAHSSMPLASGNVLLLGGHAGGPAPEAVTQTEIYSPERSRFFVSEPLEPARWNHAVAAHTGGVAVVSGQTAQRGGAITLTPSSKLYWTRRGSAPAFTDLPQLIPPRRNFVLSNLSDGRLLASGGLDTNGLPLTRLDQLRPSAARWEPAESAALTIPRAYHTATALNDGSVVFIGGLTRDRRATAVIERWSSDGTLSDVGSLRVARWAHTSTLLPDQRILVLGGFAISLEGSPSQSCEILELVHDRYETQPTGCAMKLPRAGHSATLLPSAWVVVAGGVTETEDGLSVTNTAEIFVY